MQRDEHRQKLAEISGKPDSEAMYKILERALSSEEARFVLALPAANADLAAQFNTDEKAIEEKILNLAQRGLLSPSPNG